MAEEYIEREAVLMGLDLLAYYFGCGDEKYGVERAKQIVETQPTADVVEVRHGRWVKGDMPTYGGYKCSVCRENTVHYKANYCPNCGAKMDGATDTNVGGKDGNGDVVTCLNCKHLMFSDMYGECNKQLRIVNPGDSCEYAEPKDGKDE